MFSTSEEIPDYNGLRKSVFVTEISFWIEKLNTALKGGGVSCSFFRIVINFLSNYHSAFLPFFGTSFLIIIIIVT